MKSRKRSWVTIELRTCFPLSPARSSLVILTFYWGWQGKYMQDHEGAGWGAAGISAQFVQFNLSPGSARLAEFHFLVEGHSSTKVKLTCS